MKHLTSEEGITDSDSNPFTLPSWVKQGFSLTPGRKEQLPALFGQDMKYIKEYHLKNDGMYVAFVAIRWGFAKIIKGKLAPTEKWINRHLYDGHGRPLKLKTNY